MNADEHLRDRMIDEFRTSYEKTQGGIFTQITRERILTKKGISGRGRTRDQFWYRHRENVKTALIDLQLFIEFAGRNNVNQVVTQEALEPIVKALLWHPILDQEPPDRNRAEIANLFIKVGFEYLRKKKGYHVTLSHGRTIEEALNLSGYLVEQFKSEE